jgi:hypothetical protein
MSTEATPDAGSECRFTEADLKLMAYIYQQTQRGGQTTSARQGNNHHGERAYRHIVDDAVLSGERGPRVACSKLTANRQGI